MTADFRTRQMRPCQVPDVIQTDMDRQTQDLLDMGLSRLSDSPMFSPVMCVALENNGVHNAGDSEELNSCTVGDVCSRSTSVGRDTHIGPYEWLRRPFSLKNPGATFARTVRSELTSNHDCGDIT